MSIDTRPSLFARLFRVLPAVLCLALAVADWAVFRPGLIDPDGLWQYPQAVARSYDDWHSVIMTPVIAGVIALGGSLATITLMQAVAGCFGVYCLAGRWLQLLYRDRLTAVARSWLALAVLLALLSPLSPLLYYLVHLRNDTWEAILLLWLACLALALFQPSASRAVRPVCRVLFLGLAVLAPLVRPNALVVVPVFCLLTFVLLRSWGWKAALATAVGLAAAVPAAKIACCALLHVRPWHPEQQVMGLDLVGLCVLDDGIRSQLPYTSQYLVEDRYRQGYAWGNVSPLYEWFTATPYIVKPGYVWYPHTILRGDEWRGHYAALSREYWGVVRRHPLRLARVKWHTYAAVLRDRQAYWHHAGTEEANFGQALNPTFTGVRAALARLDGRLVQTRLVRRLGAWHLPWLLLTAGLVLGTGAAWALTRRTRPLLACLVLAVPLAYYLSFLLAIAAHDYRYLYPATLSVEVAAGAAAAGVAVLAAKAVWRRLPHGRLAAADEKPVFDRYPQPMVSR